MEEEQREQRRSWDRAEEELGRSGGGAGTEQRRSRRSGGGAGTERRRSRDGAEEEQTERRRSRENVINLFSLSLQSQNRLQNICVGEPTHTQC